MRKHWGNSELVVRAGMQRVFIGIPVDKHLQKKINELSGPIKNSNPNLRWVAETNRHLTLAFIGNIPDLKVEILRRQFEQAYQGCSQFKYRFSRLARFPGAASGIIALTGEPDTAMDHIFQLTRRFLGNVGFDFDSKKFRPHVTLARIRRKQQLNTSFLHATELNLAVDRVWLYQSSLTASGSIYSTLEETMLSNAAES
ncbi:MAG: RNA 2',3'-cyclic phosphodiesterase [Xanthomonadales bacterium]|nr:RNA 2',3'-cyclic phosphodiesterase [Xanthomonadales bacterium]